MEKAKKKLILVTENLKFLTLYLSQKSFNGNLIWIFFCSIHDKNHDVYISILCLLSRVIVSGNISSLTFLVYCMVNPI